MTHQAGHSFTHLHVHSQFSLLGATPAIPDLVGRAVADGFTHLALTDTNGLYGAVSFAAACRDQNLQPVVGMKTTMAIDDDDGSLPDQMVLLAKNSAGYRSLCRLSSTLQGTPQRESVIRRGLPWKALSAERAGLICIYGGRRSRLDMLLRYGNRAEAARAIAHLAGLFGDDLFLAIELHHADDLRVAKETDELATRFGVAPVAVQPIYCLQPKERRRLRLLAAIDRNCLLSEVPDNEMPDGGDVDHDLHWLAPDEMISRFAAFPTALETAGRIAADCEPALPSGKPIWPVVSLPPTCSAEEFLQQAAAAGMRSHYGDQVAHTTKQRLTYELKLIAEHGFSSLFLLVADLVRFAREQKIPVSTRGSVADSLVAYCVGITTVDPVRHDLLFERFLNPARANPPDIDLDFCSRRRDEVLNYVRDTYGSERVALVATVSTMQPKSALRETAKAYDLDEAAITRLLRKVLDNRHPDPRRRRRGSAADLIRKLDDPLMREVAHAGYALVGQPHHLSIHPGGVVITPGPLTDVVPVQWAPKGFLITQFDHADLEVIGLPKVDLLGIRALTVLADAAELVRRYHDDSFQLAAIPADDPATGDLLRTGATIGVFQCESTGAQRTLRQLDARNITDLAVANAFFKPGPATGGMAASFIRRYRNEEETSYLHPTLAPILGASKGVLLFQEQILRVAREIAGLSWEEADHLRRGMSKFQADEMEAMRERFVEGCRRPDPGFSPEQAETLWEQVVAFAGYGFNQGHATAYAVVSYQSAYIKRHWPAEFLCARLADRGGFHHPTIYMAEAVRLGIRVHPPHVNKSRRRFSLDRGCDGPILWMGLNHVRDLRRAATATIIAERRQGPYQNLRNLLTRVSLQQKEITHLIECGALDGLGSSRAALLAELAELRRAGSALQLGLGFDAPIVEEEGPGQRLAWEKRILGQSISVHPLSLADRSAPSLQTLTVAALRETGSVQAAVVRLPGWTGGSGYFVGDENTYFVATAGTDLSRPPLWEPIRIWAHWRRDEWGSRWLAVERWESLPLQS